MAVPADRLQQLDAIEREIASALQSAGQAISELSKEKPGTRHVENHTATFLKTLETVENTLSQHINYLTQVSTGQPHEGSSYAAQKDLQMASHRLEHVRTRLSDLERFNKEHVRLHQVPLQRSMSGTTDPSSMMQRSMSQNDPLQSLQRSFSLTDAHGLQRTFSQEQH